MKKRRLIKESGKVFRDPVHSLIRIDRSEPVLLDLIDTPVFQRLRRIRQLGVSALTYHGAEHSRFVHSLGVMNFAQRIIEALLLRHRGTEVETYLRKEAVVIKCAALLHDIGHGPFSHVIERAFGRKKHHEHQTLRIIRDARFGVRSTLEEHGVDPESVASLIDPAGDPTLGKDIISSQLDADRMDYLLRDSHGTGVKYGLYDPEWILNAMCVGIGLSARAGESDPSVWRLCLDRSRGKEAAEQFILARSHMNEQVYFHRVTRGYEVALLQLFRAASDSSNDLPVGTPTSVRAFLAGTVQDDPECWLRFDESAMIAAFQAWGQPSALSGNPNLAERSTAFLFRERGIDSAPISRLRQADQHKMFEALRQVDFLTDRDYHIDDIESSIYKGITDSFGKEAEGQSIESILLTSGKLTDRAAPIEREDPLMRYLEQVKSLILRMYFDRSRSEQFARVLSRFSLKPHSMDGDRP